MQEGDDLLNYIKKVKGFAEQLVALEKVMRNEDIVMVFFESLSALYQFLIIAMKTIPMKELTMDYVTTRLMDEMSKYNEKTP